MSSKKTVEKRDRGLPFFGVGKILPFVKPYRRTLITMGAALWTLSAGS